MQNLLVVTCACQALTLFSDYVLIPKGQMSVFLCPLLGEGRLVSVSLPQSLGALQQKDTCHYERLNLALS